MSGYDHWMTDPKWIELARTCMGSIDFDPASNFVAQEYVQATTFCVTKEDYATHLQTSQYGNVLVDGLHNEWHGNVWCNPPYSRGNIDAFTQKAIREWKLSNAARESRLNSPKIHQMLFLVNSATDSKWYHDLLNTCSAVLLVRGRIKFWKIENGKAYEKWQGEKSKKDGTNKIGNSPRYLNTLFYFGSVVNTMRFVDMFGSKGTILCKK